MERWKSNCHVVIGAFFIIFSLAHMAIFWAGYRFRPVSDLAYTIVLIGLMALSFIALFSSLIRTGSIIFWGVILGIPTTAFLYFLSLEIMFSDTNYSTKVQMTESPDGNYVARVVSSDQWVWGMNTLLYVRAINRDIPLGIGRLERQELCLRQDG